MESTKSDKYKENSKKKKFSYNNNNNNNGNSIENSYQAYSNSNGGSTNNNGTPIPFDSWLDRTTARLLNVPPPNDVGTTSDNSKTSSSYSPYSLASSSSSSYIPIGQLTPDDVQLITTLMTSHARRGTVESALICEQLLKRVVEEVNVGNRSVRVTTKMYTVAMDAWAKSQRRPLPGSGLLNDRGDGDGKNASEGGARSKGCNKDDNNDNNNSNSQARQQQHQRQQKQLQLHPQQLQSSPHKQQQLPLGAAAHRAHRIHNSLVQTYKERNDSHLAPSTISYNAAINAWSKSYHPSAGEMAELLLGEMMREWRFGESVAMEDEEDEMSYDSDDYMNDSHYSNEEGYGEEGEEDNSNGEGARGNERVKPDVVTFTAVIDAWVKCTALAHDYHYEQRPAPPSHSANNTAASRQEKENYVEWKRNQAAKADALTQRAATRAKQLLNLMIQLGHYDPIRHGTNLTEGEVASPSFSKCEPSMRPNCYTYSAVMNALAKSCSALRVVSPGSSGGKAGYQSSNSNNNYDPAKEAQDMLESMIVMHERYKERVGDSGLWKNAGYTSRYDSNNDWVPDEDMADDSDGDDEDEGSEKYKDWLASSWTTNATLDSDNVDDSKAIDKVPTPNIKDPHWFDPRPDELTFPPNTINYNSVLNAWSRASRYDSQAALRAEQILLERMERPHSEGGDAVEPDALSYSLVIHAWLRGCRGTGAPNGGGGKNSRYSSNSRGGGGSGRDLRAVYFTDQDRINRAMEIADRMEAWARKTHVPKWTSKSYSGDFMDTFDGDDEEDESDDDVTALDDLGDNDDEDFIESRESFKQSTSKSSGPSFRQHNKSRDLDVEVYK